MSSHDLQLFAVNEDPELALIAAMIEGAVIDANGGHRPRRQEARHWIRHCAPWWLSLICPPEYQPEVLHAGLLKRIGESVSDLPEVPIEELKKLSPNSNTT